jgi:hypothetical protein
MNSPLPSPARRPPAVVEVPLQLSLMMDAAAKIPPRSPPRRVKPGCDHVPHTCYLPSQRLIFCSDCARAVVDEVERSAHSSHNQSPNGTTPRRLRWDGLINETQAEGLDQSATTYTHISTMLIEAETLLAELSFRQRQASTSLASAPAFSDLENERERLKRQVDEKLLAVVRHVNDTRTRLHGDIDGFVAQRAEQVTQLVKCKHASDEMLDLFEPALRRSSDFDVSRAIDVLLALKENVTVYDELARLSAAVCAPFKLSLRAEYAKFDLSGMRVCAVHDVSIDDSPSEINSSSSTLRVKPSLATDVDVRRSPASREL